jgi:hypothetical protein
VAWEVSVKNWFKGPVRYTTVEELTGNAAAPQDLIELERALSATGETPDVPAAD